MIRLFALLCLLALPARATPTLNGAFDLWIGGLPIGGVVVSTRETDVSWRVEADGKAATLLRLFVPGRAHAEAEGPVADAPRAARFEARGDFGDGLQVVSMAPDPGGALTMAAEPPLRQRGYDATPADLVHARDPLTAALWAFGADAPEAVCGKTVPVFDSRRRFDLILGKPRREGDVISCDGRYRRIAGYKAKHLKRPDAEFTLRFRVENGLARLERLAVPTDFGAAVMMRVD